MTSSTSITIVYYRPPIILAQGDVSTQHVLSERKSPPPRAGSVKSGTPYLRSFGWGRRLCPIVIREARTSPFLRLVCRATTQGTATTMISFACQRSLHTGLSADLARVCLTRAPRPSAARYYIVSCLQRDSRAWVQCIG